MFVLVDLYLFLFLNSYTSTFTATEIESTISATSSMFNTSLQQEIQALRIKTSECQRERELLLQQKQELIVQLKKYSSFYDKYMIKSRTKRMKHKLSSIDSDSQPPSPALLHTFTIDNKSLEYKYDPFLTNNTSNEDIHCVCCSLKTGMKQIEQKEIPTTVESGKTTQIHEH